MDVTVRHKAELRAKQCLGLYWACRVSRLARTLGGCLEEETKVRKANLTHNDCSRWMPAELKCPRLFPQCM